MINQAQFLGTGLNLFIQLSTILMKHIHLGPAKIQITTIFIACFIRHTIYS